MIKSINNPVFLQRISDSCCPVCRNHKFVIVVKVASVYFMTTSVSNVNTYIHRWSHRSKDPMCLSMFEYVCDAPVSFNKGKGKSTALDDSGPVEYSGSNHWASVQAVEPPPSSH